MTDKVLAETIGACEGSALRVKEAALVAFGVALITVFAKVSVPMWPVPITMGTFAVLCVGALYGPRLGLVTVLAYMLVGAAGFDVFVGSSAQDHGWRYMTGSTGGYLIGYVLATLTLGIFARFGYARTPLKLALAFFVGNVMIYVPGALWLGQLYGWDKPIFAWGVAPFLLGDAVKIALAAMLLPRGWQVLDRLRRSGAA
ncbi:Biotin transporter BioY [Aquimixticola soesokkakensis]|uniref:Biotin transporter n=2 Tax=Aquimixticola soesokkakensis TaxID=1519096 RepID=A0A1Y5SQ21_9RHOB|nr:biotin transporter BioY [Aquimixticola soesokkakensis]SLN45511.1 Biotin transporter BioY [Aquimixticola soesokkakensis]